MYDININIAAHYIEKLANVGACLPVYGTKVIIRRLFGGVIQAVAGVFARVISWCVEKAIDYGFLKEWSKKEWQKRGEDGAEHAKHGFFNVGVAISQLVIGYFTFNLGNLFIYYYKGNFDPYISYKGIVSANSYARAPLSPYHKRSEPQDLPIKECPY